MPPPPAPEPAQLQQSAAQLAVRTFANTQEATEAVLALMAEVLGMRSVFLTRTDAARGQLRVEAARNQDAGFAVRPGQELPLALTPCDRVTQRLEPVVIRDMQANPACAPFPSVRELGARAYVGVPVLDAAGHALGTLCGLDPEPQEASPQVLAWMQVLARLVGFQLERDALLAEARAAREAQEAERARLHRLVESAPVVVATVSGPEHVFNMVNPLYQRAVGGARALVGLPVRDALPELREQGILELLDSVFHTGEPFVGREVPMRLDRDGTGQLEDTFWTFVYQPTRDAHRRVDGIAAFGFEVTEQVRARQAAEAARAQLEAIFESSPEALYVGDASGIRQANRPAIELLGFRTLEEVQKPTAVLTEAMNVRRADTGAPVRAEDNPFNLALQGQSVVVELLMRHQQTGEDRVVRNACAPVWVNGQVVAAVGINQDITALRAQERERERLVEALAAERARLLAVLESAPVGVIIVNAEGQVVLANARTATELRQATSQMRSVEDMRQWAVLGPDGDPLPLEEYPLLRGLRGESASGVELGYRFPDGTQGALEAAYGPVRDAAGRIIASVVVFSDITPRKREQALLRERVAFEQQLIGIVSHDLRNPLHAILLSTASLLRREEVDARTVKAISRIQTSAERAARMVRDLLDFTQMRLGGGLPLQRQDADLRELARTALEELQAAFPERVLRLEVQGDTRGRWDADRLTQVVGNLVTNALKYSPEDTPVEVALRSEAAQAVLEVRNAGTPIPPELVARLFQPLQRGDVGAVGGAERSVGLGLYIVDQVVRAHGGRVEVRSDAVGGTRFTVTLPR